MNDVDQDKQAPRMSKRTTVVTDRDRKVLRCLARYHLLNRRQLQRLCFPAGPDGARIARRRLAALAEGGHVQRHTFVVASGYEGNPAPVYLLTQRGLKFLADESGDDRLLLKPTKVPHAGHLFHALAVAEFRILLDEAIAAQNVVRLDASFGEFDIVNPAEPDPAKHFRLFTVLKTQPRLVCSPDAGFVLEYRGHRDVVYLELERGCGDRGTGTRQLASRKAPAYAELARQGGHGRHHSAVNRGDFTVLMVLPTPKRRDVVRRSFGERDPIVDRTDLWRFAAMSDLTVETLLHGGVLYPASEAQPSPLVRS
jgi:hypothetical protein